MTCRYLCITFASQDRGKVDHVTIYELVEYNMLNAILRPKGHNAENLKIYI